MDQPLEHAHVRETESPGALTVEHVISDISNRLAGPTYSVTQLCDAISRHGSNVRLHALEPASNDDYTFPVAYYPRWPYPASLGISPTMKRGLTAAAQDAEIMHFHGLWTMPSVYPGRAVRQTGCSLVMSPRGMLDAWALNWSRRRKELFSAVMQRKVLDQVDCFHATSNQEADAIREAGFGAPIAVIPIGIDIPRVRPIPTPGTREMLFLSRLHPKKNVESLLTAWVRVQDRNPQWSLRVAGDGDASYVASLEALASDLSAQRVEFCGPLFDNDKDDAFERAQLFVLPTFSENFGIVVVEALSHGVPVITTTGTPWQSLETMNSGWWIDPDVVSLATALDRAMNTDEATLASMGASGRQWMHSEFTWDRVGEMTAELYRWLRGQSPQPSFLTTQ